MQRAASSDTLSTMALDSGDGPGHRSLHDAKQHLCHSQSMVLPENGKVQAIFPLRLCVCAETKIVPEEKV